MGKWIAELGPYSKAIRGTMVAILGGVLVALTNGDGITAQEWVMIALAALGVGEGVYSTRNTTAAGLPMPGGSFPVPDELPRIEAGGTGFQAERAVEPATYETGRAPVQWGR